MLCGANMCASMRRFLAWTERDRVEAMLGTRKLLNMSYQRDFVKPVECP